MSKFVYNEIQFRAFVRKKVKNKKKRPYFTLGFVIYFKLCFQHRRYRVLNYLAKKKRIEETKKKFFANISLKLLTMEKFTIMSNLCFMSLLGSYFTLYGFYKRKKKKRSI